MPTYKYKREDGTTFEKRQSINDDPLEECPNTGQKVKRVISGGGGVIYKGDGFYVNDYKDKPSNESSSEDSNSSQNESSNGSSAETTSATDNNTSD